MARGNHNNNREGAIYCARLNAEIGNRESTWTYRNGDGELFEVTARPDGNGGVVTETRRSEF
jgi:hypothetical protein